MLLYFTLSVYPTRTKPNREGTRKSYRCCGIKVYLFFAKGEFEPHFWALFPDLLDSSLGMRQI
jgi:hypothetical protein